MTFFPFWAIYALVSLVLMYLGFRNTELLSPEQEKERQRILHEANQLSRWQNWSFLSVLVILVLLNWTGIAEISWVYYHFIVIGQVLYTIIRNQRLFRKANFPESFTNREMLIRSGSVVLLVILMVRSS